MIHGYVIILTPISIFHLSTDARLRWPNDIVFLLVATVGSAYGFYDSTYDKRVYLKLICNQKLNYMLIYVTVQELQRSSSKSSDR